MSMAGGRITISRLLMLGALVSVGLWLCPDGVWAGESTGHDFTLIASIAVGLALGLWGQLILQMTRLQAARLRAARQQRPYDG